MKYLHAQGYIDGTCLTVTGQGGAGGGGQETQHGAYTVGNIMYACTASPRSHPHTYTQGCVHSVPAVLLNMGPQPPLLATITLSPCPPVLFHPAGKTVAENLAGCPDLSAGQDVVLPVSSPIKPSGHIQILYGNLAPEGSVAKITGKEGLKFTGQVRTAIQDDCVADIHLHEKDG